MKSKKILIVEDDRDIAENLQELLECEGYRVHLASNGQEALNQLRSESELPSLIILDLMMPVMDGSQFRQEQEKDLKLAGIPVVIMTADGNIAAKKAKVSAKVHLRKPLDVDVVLDAIKQFVL